MRTILRNVGGNPHIILHSPPSSAFKMDIVIDFLSSELKTKRIDFSPTEIATRVGRSLYDIWLAAA